MAQFTITEMLAELAETVPALQEAPRAQLAVRSQAEQSAAQSVGQLEKPEARQELAGLRALQALLKPVSQATAELAETAAEAERTEVRAAQQPH